jgi:hypothetical protein
MMGWNDKLKNKKARPRALPRRNSAKQRTTSRWNVKARATRA